VPIIHPRSSSGVFALVEEAAESFTSADVKLREDVGIGDRVGERVQRAWRQLWIHRSMAAFMRGIWHR
jgi:hypothetical protein